MVVSYTTDELMQIMTMAFGVHKSLTRNLTQFYGRNPTLFGQITRLEIFTLILSRGYELYRVGFTADLSFFVRYRYRPVTVFD